MLFGVSGHLLLLLLFSYYCPVSLLLYHYTSSIF